jgi:GntR family transcriptional regulator
MSMLSTRHLTASRLTTPFALCTIVLVQRDTSVFVVDPSEPTPIYAQLEREIRLAVATGELEVGDQLPTVRQLAVDLSVNANTVAKVYQALEKAGILQTQRGVGTFIASSRGKGANRSELERRLNALADRFLLEAAALGFDAEQAVAALRLRAKGGVKNHGNSERP